MKKKGGKKIFKVDFDSIWTYADPNISYLVSTGLVDKIGKKIILNSSKKEISKIISKEKEIRFTNDYEYLSIYQRMSPKLNIRLFELFNSFMEQRNII